jgi:hypothetical protein
MKRIKLFEAFNNTEKIDKINEFLIRWGVCSYFKENKFTSRFVNPDTIVIQDINGIYVADYSLKSNNLKMLWDREYSPKSYSSNCGPINTYLEEKGISNFGLMYDPFTFQPVYGSDKLIKQELIRIIKKRHNL